MCDCSESMSPLQLRDGGTGRVLRHQWSYEITIGEYHKGALCTVLDKQYHGGGRRGVISWGEAKDEGKKMEKRTWKHAFNDEKKEVDKSAKAEKNKSAKEEKAKAKAEKSSSTMLWTVRGSSRGLLRNHHPLCCWAGGATSKRYHQCCPERFVYLFSWGTEELICRNNHESTLHSRQNTLQTFAYWNVCN